MKVAAFRASGVAFFTLATIETLALLRFAEFPTSFDSAWNRLSDPFLRWVEWATILSGLAHGALGLLLLVDARVRTPSWRAGATGAVLVAAFLVASLATAAYLTMPLFPRPPVYGGP